MTPGTNITLSVFLADELERRISEFGVLLHACVENGASVGFVLPFSAADSEDFWRNKVVPGIQKGGLVLLVALLDNRVAGSVQLDHDTPPNQPHRAEVRKLLVHPDFRRRGLAKAMIVEIERIAKRRDRSLITLDTRTGDAAEPLYAAMGYETAGIIPGFCRDTINAGRFDPTTIMYKAL